MYNYEEKFMNKNQKEEEKSSSRSSLAATIITKPAKTDHPIKMKS
jgi:hypothetical protein